MDRLVRGLRVALDTLVDALRVEPDPDKRRHMVSKAQAIVHAALALLPLYHRTIARAMRKGIVGAICPHAILELRFVTLPR